MLLRQIDPKPDANSRSKSTLNMRALDIVEKRLSKSRYQLQELCAAKKKLDAFCKFLANDRATIERKVSTSSSESRKLACEMANKVGEKLGALSKSLQRIPPVPLPPPPPAPPKKVPVPTPAPPIPPKANVPPPKPVPAQQTPPSASTSSNKLPTNFTQDPRESTCAKGDASPLQTPPAAGILLLSSLRPVFLLPVFFRPVTSFQFSACAYIHQ